MPITTDVADWLIARDGFAFTWKSGGMTIAGGLSEEGGLDNVTEIMTTPLSCYEIVLWAARRCGAARATVWNFIDDIFRAAAQNNDLRAASFPAGLSRYYFGAAAPARAVGSYPNKGDVVLFSAGGTKYLAHVALATGNEYEVMSFGHDGPADAPATGVGLMLKKMTINDILTTNQALDKVEFGRPVW
ncbi:MAG: hypothetical protein AAFY59_01705 [Pseudomonadota bacterium]